MPPLKNTELKSIDWALGKKLAADNLELAKDLFTMLINDLPQELQIINDSYQTHNLKVLSHHVHKLHGGCCYVGVPKLKHIAKTLEQAITNADKNGITTLIAALNAEIAFILQAEL